MVDNIDHHLLAVNAEHLYEEARLKELGGYFSLLINIIHDIYLLNKISEPIPIHYLASVSMVKAR